jgi:hypothetical protein
MTLSFVIITSVIALLGVGAVVVHQGLKMSALREAYGKLHSEATIAPVDGLEKSNEPTDLKARLESEIQSIRDDLNELSQRRRDVTAQELSARIDKSARGLSGVEMDNPLAEISKLISDNGRVHVDPVFKTSARGHPSALQDLDHPGPFDLVSRMSAVETLGLAQLSIVDFMKTKIDALKGTTPLSDPFHFIPLNAWHREHNREGFKRWATRDGEGNLILVSVDSHGALTVEPLEELLTSQARTTSASSPA